MAGLIRDADRRQHNRSAEVDDDGAPLLATIAAFDEPMTPTRADGRGHAGLVSAKRPGTINLKSVAQACIDAGLDPALEIARVLSTKVPVLDNNGNPKKDKDGQPLLVDLIDPDTKLRTLTQLLEYNQPKLKAVEMKISGTLDLTSEELDQRLTAMLSKAKK
jgi:hypothetical protein